MITVDSFYVKGLIDEKFVARENRALPVLKVTKKKNATSHTLGTGGHTGDVGQSIVDELADLGTRMEVLHRWWKRVQPMVDWEEDVFQTEISSPQRKNTVRTSSSQPVDRRGGFSLN